MVLFLVCFFFTIVFSLYFFPLLQNSNKLCLLLLYSDYDNLGRRDFLFITCLPYIFPYSLLVSYLLLVSLSYFIFAVPMHECLGEHSCMSSIFPIAILNGACFFLTVQLQVRGVCSEWKTRNSLSTGKPEPLN